MEPGSSSEEIEKLIERIRSANPFDSDKVCRASDTIVDVPEIHRKYYARLLGEMQKVKETGKSRGVLIKGVAGAGKSHLIARLFGGRPKNVLFFQIEALPGEATGWLKHILQCIVRDLQQPAGLVSEQPQLSILIQHLISGVKEQIGMGPGEGTDIIALDRALDARAELMSREIPDPIVEDLLTALVNIWKWNPPFRVKGGGEKKKKTDLTVRWLKGCHIDDDELKHVGLRDNLGEEDESGDLSFLTALRVIGTLTKGQAPIVLAFDQLDAISDKTINSFGNQLLHLIGGDSAAPNFLVVTAGVQEQMERFERDRIISRAVADVLFKTELELPALTGTECERIVAARLTEVINDKERRLLTPSAGELFPFTRDFLKDALAGPIAPSPRRVLKIADSSFEAIKDVLGVDWLRNWPHVATLTNRPSALPEPSVEVIDAFLDEELAGKIQDETRRLSKDPIDGDYLANTLMSLIHLTESKGPLRVGKLPEGEYDLPTQSYFSVRLNSDTGARSGVLFVENRGNWNSVNAVLRKQLRFCEKFDVPEIAFFIRDARAKRMDNWKKPQEIISKLNEMNRLAIVSLDESEVAALSALDRLRKELPDLLIAPSEKYRDYQITAKDLGDYLARRNRLASRPLFKAIKETLSNAGSRSSKSASIPPEPPVSQSLQKVQDFVFARLQVKKVFGYEAMLLEWANFQGKVSPSHPDRALFENAVKTLKQAGKIIYIAAGPKAILKKKAP